MEIFELTKSFPKEEKYSLVDQIRRSSRSVPANIAEAWYKRKYPKSFVSKLIDAAGETGETEVWIDFSFDHNYILQQRREYFLSKYGEVGRMLYERSNNLRNSVINFFVLTTYYLLLTAYCLLPTPAYSVIT